MELSSKNFYLYQYIDVIKVAFANNKNAKLDVVGSSMMPTLCEGDFVILEKPQNIKKGDIILYNLTDTTFAMHRVVSVDDNLKVYGDNNIISESIDKKMVVAKVKTIVKNNKKIENNSIKYAYYKNFASIRRFLRKVRNKIAK